MLTLTTIGANHLRRNYSPLKLQSESSVIMRLLVAGMASWCQMPEGRLGVAGCRLQGLVDRSFGRSAGGGTEGLLEGRKYGCDETFKRHYLFLSL